MDNCLYRRPVRLLLKEWLETSARKVGAKYSYAYSPDYPLAIKNLFDSSTAVLGDINSTTGEISTTVTYRVVSDFIPVDTGETYKGNSSLITTDETVGINSALIIAEYDSDKAFITGTRRSISSQKFTVTDPDTAYVRCEFYCSNIGAGNTIDITKSKMQLEVGETSNDFVPFGINKFVKNNKDDSFGYLNEITKEFTTIVGATGEVIQPVSYVESDGTTQYIDTGIIPTTFDYTITYEGAIKKLSAGPNCAWGYMGNSSNLPRWVCATYSNKYLLNANTTSQIDVTADTNNHTFVGKVYENGDVAKWSSKLDGVAKQDQTLVSEETWATNTLSIYLFARHNADGAGNFATATLKRWICEKNGIEICNIIPVRIGTTAYMLDKVNWKVYANAGTGSFTYGEDVPW